MAASHRSSTLSECFWRSSLRPGWFPASLEPGRIELLLSKPLSRTHLLLGRFLGNVLLVTLNSTYLVLGVWVILGAKTGIWSPAFLIAIATTTFIFAVLLSVVVLIGVTLESAAAATMITVALMIISPILAQTQLMMRLLSSEWSRDLWRTLYYVFPKVYELGKITLDAIQSGTFAGFTAIWTSALFGIAMLGAALVDFPAERFLVRGALAAVLCCLALSGCLPKKSASLHVSPALEALVPADTVVVLGFNLAALRDTAIYQKLSSRVPLPQLDEFERQTGLDPRKDLSEFLLCSNGKNALLLVRGKFRITDLEARFKSKGVTPENYKGHALFGDQRAVVTFLDDSTAAAGATAELHALIDQVSARQGGLPADLRDLLRTLPADDQVYAALTGGLQNLNLPLSREGNMGNVLDALKSVQSAILGMNLSKGIDAVAIVNCKTAGDAKFVHDLVRGLVGFGRLNTPDNKPEMLKLYDSIQVTQQEAQTKVTADVPQDLTDHFLDLWFKK